MEFILTPLKGAYIIQLKPRADERGHLVRLFAKEELKQIGHDEEIVHINHTLTKQKGTLRGMHYQQPPHSEIKIMTCLKGEVYDVIIDLRKGSPTFLKWHAEILSPDKMNMIYVPKGFAHGFQTLKNDCEMLYFHTTAYHQPSERGIRYNDPIIGIKWPLPFAQLSERDTSFSMLTKDFTGVNP